MPSEATIPWKRLASPSICSSASVTTRTRKHVVDTEPGTDEPREKSHGHLPIFLHARSSPVGGRTSETSRGSQHDVERSNLIKQAACAYRPFGRSQFPLCPERRPRTRPRSRP